jgi:NADH:ubiquinone oxidoreductase subunit 5 (subunit L)/multisubunit Na+/H+ antiporter MnhA subunit
VEKQAGTTDLARLGGLGAKMPITFTCFIIAAAAISGVPPFNGFFSKELVYDGALERHWGFYAAALLGSFLTAASFLKLGHSAFLGKRNAAHSGVREAPLSMLLPMIVIAGGCVLFGLWNALPLNYLIQPILGEHRLEGHTFAGWPASIMLIAATVAVLGLALVNHLVGAKRAGSGLGAADHIHHAPVLATIYDKAENRWFDPYDIGLKIVNVASWILWGLDRFIDWIYNGLSTTVALLLGQGIRLVHTGQYAMYVIWSLVGAALVVALVMGIL